jgi:hypothetical protein
MLIRSANLSSTPAAPAPLSNETSVESPSIRRKSDRSWSAKGSGSGSAWLWLDNAGDEARSGGTVTKWSLQLAARSVEQEFR